MIWTMPSVVVESAESVNRVRITECFEISDDNKNDWKCMSGSLTSVRFGLLPTIPSYALIPSAPSCTSMICSRLIPSLILLIWRIAKYVYISSYYLYVDISILIPSEEKEPQMAWYLRRTLNMRKPQKTWRRAATEERLEWPQHHCCILDQHFLKALTECQRLQNEEQAAQWQRGELMTRVRACVRTSMSLCMCVFLIRSTKKRNHDLQIKSLNPSLWREVIMLAKYRTARPTVLTPPD